MNESDVSFSISKCIYLVYFIVTNLKLGFEVFDTLVLYIEMFYFSLCSGVFQEALDW